jgi:hypothetical protein
VIAAAVGLIAVAVGAAVSGVEHARVDADYVPAASLDLSIARDALRDAFTIMRLLGVTRE